MIEQPSRGFARYPLRNRRIWTPRERWLGLMFAGPLLLAYLITLPGGVGWWDSGELIGGASTLSVVHRPGFPLYVLGGHVVFGWLSDPRLLANAMSAVCAAFALLFIWRALHMLLGNGLWTALWVAVGGWFVGFAPLFWRQALRAEVYAPVFCVLGAAFLLAVAAQRAPDPRAAIRRFLGTAFLAGLAFCLHSAVAVAAWPVFIMIFLLGDFRPSVRQWLWSTAFLVAGLTVYLYVPLRAPYAPYVWGDPTTWDGFWTYLSASDSFGVIAAEAGGTLDRAAWLLDVVFENSSALLIALGLGGLLVGAAAKRQLGRAPLLLLVCGTAVAATVVSSQIADNFDTQAYLFPLLWALWWGFALLDPLERLARLGALRKWGHAAAAAAAGVCVPLVVWAGIHGGQVVEPFELELADRWGEELLSGSDDGDLIVLQDANTDFLLRGILASSADAPRVTVLNAAFAGAPWYRSWFMQRLIGDGAPTLSGGPGWSREVAAWWREHRGRVLVDVGTPGWIPSELLLTGYLCRWVQPSVTNVNSHHSIPRMNTPLSRSDPDWVRTQVWYYYRLGLFYRDRGEISLAASAWDEALSWSPNEPELLEARNSLPIAQRVDPPSDSAGVRHLQGRELPESSARP